MKSIIGVIFLVFVILIGFSYMDKYFYPSHLESSSQVETSSSDTSDTSEEKVEVVLSGCVNKPGTYKASNGSFLLDFIEQAGGITTKADTSCYDPYYQVVDDIEIYIAPTSEEAKISINEASVEELTLLQGIGFSTAQKIVNYREAYGSFGCLEDIMKVNGIGKTIFGKIKDSICL